LEPVIFDEPVNNFLHNLRDICTKNGTILIFDEMWTGFRILPGGAQEYFGVNADLACFSKAVANGMPISVLTGRKEIMSLLEKDVFFYTTFGGEALSLAAAKATMQEMIDKRVSIYLTVLGKKLKDCYNAIASYNKMNYTKCIGYGYRTMITFNSIAGNQLEIKSLMQQELIRRGILWSGSHNICFSHSESDIEHTIDVYEEILPIIKQAIDRDRVRELIKGQIVEPVFRKTDKFNTKPKISVKAV
jgi:glutamate-1-semialdehyde aminotransferase